MKIPDEARAASCPPTRIGTSPTRRSLDFWNRSEKITTSINPFISSRVRNAILSPFLVIISFVEAHIPPIQTGDLSGFSFIVNVSQFVFALRALS